MNRLMRSVSDPMRDIRIAGTFATEVLLRKPHQVFVGGCAQIRTDSLRDEGQCVGARPAQPPGEKRGAEQAGRDRA